MTAQAQSPTVKFAAAWLVRALKDLHRDVMESRDRWEALEQEGRHDEANEVRNAARTRAAALRSLLDTARSLENPNPDRSTP